METLAPDPLSEVAEVPSAVPALPPVVVPVMGPPPLGALGVRMQALAAIVPGAIAELMQNFIEKKDLRERAIIRMRMKALLDIFAADTNHPPVPALTHGKRHQNPMMAGGMYTTANQSPAFGGMGMGAETAALQAQIEDAVQAEADAGAPSIEPVPGAEVAADSALL